MISPEEVAATKPVDGVDWLGAGGIFGGGEGVFLVDVLLEGVDVLDAFGDKAKGVEALASDHVHEGNGDVNMGQALHDFAGFGVDGGFDSGQVGFGVQVEFVALVGGGNEGFEFFKDVLHDLFGHEVFFEGEGDVVVSLGGLGLGRYVLHEVFKDVEVAAEDEAFIELVAGLGAVLFLAVFEVGA